MYKHPPALAEPVARGKRQGAARGFLAVLSLFLLAGCSHPNEGLREESTAAAADFPTLFARNCSGCHGADGLQGPAPPLNDSMRLAMFSENQLNKVISSGRELAVSGARRKKFSMPPFSQSHGGSLTDEQVQTIATGMKSAWGKPPPAIVPPPYRATDLRHAAAGANLFAQHCAKCHGDEGRGGKGAGALNAPAFLELVSDEAIRSLIITGRPDLKTTPQMPGYADIVKITPENATEKWREVDQIVAYIASWRSTASVQPVSTPPLPVQPTKEAAQ